MTFISNDLQISVIPNADLSCMQTDVCLLAIELYSVVIFALSLFSRVASSSSDTGVKSDLAGKLAHPIKKDVKQNNPNKILFIKSP